MKKRISSFVLCITLILQCFVFGASAANADAETANSAEQYVLNKLGIIEASDSTNLGAAVTRAEFAQYLNNILGYVQADKETYFIDVPASYWAAESINALLEHGVISFASDGRFNPEENVTYEQVCKLLVSALGYGAYANFEKEGMTAYVKTASRLDFSISTKNPAEVTLGEVMVMLYKAMQTDMAYTVRVGEEDKTEVSKGENWFSVYFNVYIGEGMVTAYYGASISKEKCGENDVYIDGERFYKDDCETENLVGSYCEIVYKDIKGEKTLIYAEIMNEDKTVVQSKNIVSYDKASGTIKYRKSEDSDKILSVKLPDKADIVYNGRAFIGDVSGKMDEFLKGTKCGDISIIESGSGVRSVVVIINSYEVFIAGAYDEAKSKLYGYYDNSGTYDLSGDRDVIIKTDTGIKSAMPTSYPSALLVARSEDEASINITICTKQEQFTVSLIKENGEKIVSDSGKEIDIKKDVLKHQIIELGASYTVTYDIYGDVIYAARTKSSDLKIAYLRAVVGVDESFGRQWYLRLYDRAEAVFKDLKLAEKVNIDGVRYDSDDYKKWLYAFPGEVSIKGTEVTIDRQVLRYKTDSNGDISDIDTCNRTEYEDENETLKKIADSDEALYYIASPTMRFGMNVVVDGSTTKYIVAPEVTEDGKVDVNGEKLEETIDLYGDTPKLTSWKSYNIDAYKCDSTTLAADIVVVKQTPSVERYDFIMFESVSEGVDSDGNRRMMLKGMSGGTMVEMPVMEYCEKDAEKLNAGDIIDVETRADGETITTIKKAFDYATKTFEDNEGYSDRNRYWYYGNTSQSGSQSVWQTSYHQITKSYPYDYKSNVISSAYTMADANLGNTELVSRVQGLSVGIFDDSLNRNKMYVGSASDIVTYKTAGADCDLMLICSRTTNARQIFIYK